MLAGITIDGLAFEATEAIIEMNIIGTQFDFDLLSSYGNKDIPLTSEGGFYGVMTIIESQATPSLQWLGKLNIKIKAAFRLKR